MMTYITMTIYMADPLVQTGPVSTPGSGNGLLFPRLLHDHWISKYGSLK